MYQIFPLALGRDGSEKELHVWDPECGLGQSPYAEVNEIQMECRWGAGLIEEEAVWVLYLFDRDQTLEIYFPQRIAVGPGREMNSWDVLLSMLPEQLVLVYGERPGSREHWLKITFKEREQLMRCLEDFIQQVVNLDIEVNPDPAMKKITDYLLKVSDDCEIPCP